MRGVYMKKTVRDLQQIEKCLKKDGKNADLWCEKGLSLVKERRYEEAIEAFTDGLILQPFHAELRLNRGRRYITLDDYKTAIAELTLATRLAPENDETWYYQAVALYLEGQYERCIEASKQCLRVMKKKGDENIPAAICWYWQAAMKLNKYEEAQDILGLVYENMPCENKDYLERLLLQKGLRSPEEMRKHLEMPDSEDSDLYKIGILMGLYNYYTYKGNAKDADCVLREMVNLPCRQEAFAYKQACQEIMNKGCTLEDYLV